MIESTAEGPTIRIPRARSLEERLQRCSPEQPRAKFVAEIKALRSAEIQAAVDNYRANINEATGLDVATRLTMLTDAILRCLVARAFTRARAPEAWQQQAAVFAVGGYGRGELAPYSDIDLLVFVQGRSRPDWLTNANNELQTLMWDVGFQVGASLREAGELERLMADDFVTATAVLEERLLVGEAALGQSLREVRERFRRKRAKPFLKYKIAELRARQQKAGANLFVMEPNAKTNPGCLRDIQLLRNICYIVFGSRNLHALRELGVITFEDVQMLFAANDHLMGVRTLLHAHHGHHEDHLRLPDQLWLADSLGFAQGGRLRAVEHFMRLHYERIMHVHQIVELTLSRLQALGHLGRRTLLIKTRRVLNGEFSIVDNRVYPSRRDLWYAPQLGRRLIEMCRLMQKRRLRMSYELSRSIKEHVHLLHSDEFTHDPQVAKSFLEIMGDLGAVRGILEDMHWSGLLGAYLPEFGNLTALLQFNSYHQYTADEHTLIAIGQLDRLVAGEDEGFPGCGSIARNAERKDLLALSLLLHDIGKFMGSGHVPRGALMVQPIASRMGLNEAEEELVHFLVAEHVTLSDATRTRDINDQQFIAEMVEVLGSQDRLDLLYVLTYCDANAVAEGILTGWQIAIFAELYDNVRSALRRRTADEAPPPKRQRILAALAAGGIDEERATAFLAAMPAHYLPQVPIADALEHQVLVEAASRGGIVSRHRVISPDTATVSVATTARLGLFAAIVGTLSASNFDVVDARSWVTNHHLALLTFRIESTVPGRMQNDTVWQRFDDNLRRAISGEVAVAELLESRPQLIGALKPPDSGFDAVEVRLEQRNSDLATVIDIRVKDFSGLLYHVARTIAEAGCTITYASISTYGDVARDVFYITKDARKLNAADASSVRRQVQDVLEELT